jgi:putative ABC transport system ATP-binding protein
MPSHPASSSTVASTQGKTSRHSKYAVQVSNVFKTFKSGDIEVHATNDVSFELEEGEFAAIVGPSGSGKSTLMNLLGTIDKPTRGEIYIDGIALSKMNGDDLAEFRRKKLGFVFQAFNLINGLTAEENVELPLMLDHRTEQERRQKADALLTHLGLAKRLRMRPTQLSGGEQQRVAIARALVNDPTLILADEPTGNLDSKSGDEVIRLLRNISSGSKGKVTIIMITHDPDLTRYCDKVIHIRDGKIEKIVVGKVAK